MANNIGYVYKITSPSGKAYVGQSWNLEKRWNNYRKNNGNISKHLKASFEKYGVENFKFEVIDRGTSQRELDEKEDKWIIFYDSIDNGYNMKHGGSHGKHIEATKIKCSIANKGRRLSPNTEFRKGHKWPKDMLLKMGEKISNSKKGIGLSDSHKRALRKPKKISLDQKIANSLRFSGMTWKKINNKRVWLNKTV